MHTMTGVGLSGKVSPTGPGGLVAKSAIGNPSNSHGHSKETIHIRFAYATPTMPIVAGTCGSIGDGNVHRGIQRALPPTDANDAAGHSGPRTVAERRRPHACALMHAYANGWRAKGIPEWLSCFEGRATRANRYDWNADCPVAAIRRAPRATGGCRRGAGGCQQVFVTGT